MPQSKKKRTDDEVAADVGQKPIQLQRRRVWRACESCRYVMSYVVHATFLLKSLRIFSGARRSNAMESSLLAPSAQPRAHNALGYRPKIEPPSADSESNPTSCGEISSDFAPSSYVQELEARLIHMEGLFTQIAPVLEHMGTSANGTPGAAPAATNGAPAVDVPNPSANILRPIAPKEPTSQSSTPVKLEDDVSDSFGQLALDEYGHMRWIGGSSTMSLIQNFRALTSSPLHRISPMEEDPHAPGPSVNKLYFPASVFFGKVHALPGPEEVEYPERDLADKLVRILFSI